MNTVKLKMVTTVILLASFLSPSGGNAVAAPAAACTFTTSGNTMTLRGDCTTSTSIIIPNGYTLDGAGHTITAVDPPGGHFVGGVIQNGGATAHVTELTVTVSNLSDVCDVGNDRLRGIYFVGAGGSITDSVVRNIKQGGTAGSGCVDEGMGIYVSNVGGPEVALTISRNQISNYQFEGIFMVGAVQATITHNAITGGPPSATIVRFGIAVVRASADIEHNSVADNIYTGSDDGSIGIILALAGPSTVSHNNVSTSNYGLMIDGVEGATVSHNNSNLNTDTGIFVTGGSSGNVMAHNEMSSNGGVDAEDDTTGSGTSGTANTWSHNKCTTSSPGGLCR